jgi:hypothetical protein
MSERKFNLKTYQKIDGGVHIDMRLKESRTDKAPDVINEKQLEDYRGTEPDVTIEKLLEDKRLGAETEITEKRLDTHKSKFANKYRNPEAYEGDMNKLEEKRLNSDPVENEKYETASEVPKQFRWWEGVKSPDGLKVAKTAAKKNKEWEDPVEKAEELSFDKERWRDVQEPSEELTEKLPPIDPDNADDFQIEEINKPKEIKEPSGMSSMTIQKEKYLYNPQNPILNGVYMVLAFDPETYSYEEEIKRAALETVLNRDPSLSGLISADDFGKIDTSGLEGKVVLRAVGEEFGPVAEKHNNPVPAAPSSSFIKPTNVEEEPEVEEVNYEEKTIDGTPMAIGKIRVRDEITDENRASIIEKIVSLVHEKHPRVDLEEDSLDLTNIDQGEVRYLVGVKNESVLEMSASNDFDIVVKSAVSKKN